MKKQQLLFFRAFISAFLHSGTSERILGSVALKMAETKLTKVIKKSQKLNGKLGEVFPFLKARGRSTRESCEGAESLNSALRCIA